jgi:hypothetical protein
MLPASGENAFTVDWPREDAGSLDECGHRFPISFEVKARAVSIGESVIGVIILLLDKWNNQLLLLAQAFDS